MNVDRDSDRKTYTYKYIYMYMIYRLLFPPIELPDSNQQVALYRLFQLLALLFRLSPDSCFSLIEYPLPSSHHVLLRKIPRRSIQQRGEVNGRLRRGA